MHTYDGKLANLASIEKLNTVQTGYKDMKYNFERELELLQEHIKEVQDKGGELGKRLSMVEQATFEQEQPAANINMNFNQARSASNADSALGSNRGQSQGSLRQRSPDTNTAGFGHSPTLRRASGPRVDNALLQEMTKRSQALEDSISSLEQRLDNFKKLLDDKVTRDDVRKLTSDKVTREDLEQLIPNEEILQEKMKYIVRDETDKLSDKVTDQFKVFDQKLVRLRSEIDVHSMQRQIDLKANEDSVKSDFSNHEFKISTLDRNIIRIAADFESFQHAFNKLHSAILELQEANRDVLLGKRTTNCLSCGKGGSSEGNH